MKREDEAMKSMLSVERPVTLKNGIGGEEMKRSEERRRKKEEAMTRHGTHKYETEGEDTKRSLERRQKAKMGNRLWRNARSKVNTAAPSASALCALVLTWRQFFVSLSAKAKCQPRCNNCEQPLRRGALVETGASGSRLTRRRRRRMRTSCGRKMRRTEEKMKQHAAAADILERTRIVLQK